MRRQVERRPKREAAAGGGGGGDRALLTQDDFTFLGYYDIQGGLDYGYGWGCAHRYVGEQFRLIWMHLNGSVQEATLPGTINNACTVLTPFGGEIWNGSAPNIAGFHGTLSYLDGKLWTAWAIDYPDDTQMMILDALATREISDTRVVSNFQGWWGFADVGQRAVFGGVRATPAWFQSAHGVPDRVTLSGGYTSRMNQGRTPSMGPFILFFPDPHGVYTPNDGGNTDNADAIPAAHYKIGADYRGGTSATDDYAGYPNQSKDRGIRFTTDVENYADAGDPRDNPGLGTSTVNTNGTAVTRTAGSLNSRFQTWWAGYSGTVNGSTESAGAQQVTINGVQYTVASVADADNMTLTASAGVQTGVDCTGPTNRPLIGVIDSAQWQQGPDGYHRMCWTDLYTWDWIDNDAGDRGRHGLVAVLSCVKGKFYYGNSTLNGDDQDFEVQVFDPDDVAAVVAGSLDPWMIRPASGWSIRDLLTGLPAATVGQGRQIIGSTFDPVTDRWYVTAQHYPNGVNSAKLRVYVFDVATAA